MLERREVLKKLVKTMVGVCPEDTEASLKELLLAKSATIKGIDLGNHWKE